MQIRLFTPEPLVPGREVPLSAEQVHYLRNVLRVAEGRDVFLFNGREGEFAGRIAQLDKKNGRASVEKLLRPQPPAEDVRLYFAPLKRDCTDLVVEKATELGATLICPVMTEFTVASRVNTDRLRAIAVEAAEQCRRLDIPEVAEPVSLKDMLAARSGESPLLLHLDESGEGRPAAEVLSEAKGGVAFLVGPEGGFSETERILIARAPRTAAVSLGPRILRAETAALAVLALRACLK